MKMSRDEALMRDMEAEINRLREDKNLLVAELRQVVEWATIERAPLRSQEVAHIKALIAKMT